MLKVVLSGLLSRRWVLMWVCALSCALASPAIAGLPKCKRGESRDVKLCKGQKRDLRTGCCKVPKSRLKRKRRSKAKPKPKREVCLPGQVKTEKTRGNCCYPGQYWSRAKRKCVGTPKCPSELGMVAQGAQCGCPEGQAIGQYTDGHCCWEGQEWVIGEGCVGELSAEQRGFQAKLAEAKRAQEARDRWKSVGIKFIKIPGGSFTSGVGRYAGLSVRAFELSESEVTVGQYRKCVSAGVCTNPDTGSHCNWGKSGREDHPINCVDWGQARTFARWVGGDLPTEAEWEYAARGGGRAVKYPWGNAEASCSYAVMDDGGNGCGRVSTWPVCSKRQGDTPQGLCDMAGNVWEWVLDEYKDEMPTDGNSHVGQLPTCSTVCDKGVPGRVFRGGSWRHDASSLSVAFRYNYASGDRNGNLGFRVRRTLP